MSRYRCSCPHAVCQGQDHAFAATRFLFTFLKRRFGLLAKSLKLSTSPISTASHPAEPVANRYRWFNGTMPCPRKIWVTSRYPHQNIGLRAYLACPVSVVGLPTGQIRMQQASSCDPTEGANQSLWLLTLIILPIVSVRSVA